MQIFWFCCLLSSCLSAKADFLLLKSSDSLTLTSLQAQGSSSISHMCQCLLPSCQILKDRKEVLTKKTIYFVKNKFTNQRTMSTKTTMKAAIRHKTGDLTLKETISIENDVPIPEPGQGEVLIKVSAAAINPVDWKVIKGDIVVKKLDFTGFDVSGVVEKIGPDMSTTLKLGDEIYADSAETTIEGKSGSFAEYAVVKEVAVSLKPKNVDFLEDASLPLVGLTAIQGLLTHGKFGRGQKVLIIGGSGGVGSLAIQMAKALGASEIAATGSDVEMIKGFGADYVVNYKKENLIDALKGKNFNLVYDTIGGNEHWELGQASLKKGGIFVTIVGDGNSLPRTIAEVIWRKLMSYFGGPTYNLFLTNTKAPEVGKDMKKITEFARQICTGMYTK